MNKITLPESVLMYCANLCHQAFRNEKHILQSQKCGCYNCCSVFDKEEVTHWCDCDGKGPKTALCPRCGIDSVLADSQVNVEYPPLLQLAQLVLFGDKEVSPEDMFFTDTETGKKVFFDVVDHGDSFLIKIRDNPV